MKWLFHVVIFTSFSLLCYADSWKMEGIITTLDDTSKTLILDPGYGSGVNVQVLPFTEIDMEDCGPYGSDLYGTFKDLQVGMVAEVKVFPPGAFIAQGNGLPLARKIEVECRKRRAY